MRYSEPDLARLGLRLRLDSPTARALVGLPETVAQCGNCGYLIRTDLAPESCECGQVRVERAIDGSPVLRDPRRRVSRIYRLSAAGDAV